MIVRGNTCIEKKIFFNIINNENNNAFSIIKTTKMVEEKRINV